MVSEGVDIPRLRVGVYATAAKTPMIFRQIVGRFVRMIAGTADRAQLALRARRPILRNHAADDRGECACRCADPGRPADGARQSVPSGARPSAARRPEFVPLSAEFARR